MEAELREQGEERIANFEAGIARWLDSLQLPITGEETKRQEAAHQLRILLFDLLMIDQCEDSNCISSQPTAESVRH